jgi:hypothetical protein
MERATVIQPQPSVSSAGWGIILILGAATALALWFVITFAFPYLTLDQQRFGPYWPRRGWLVLHIAGGMAALLMGPAQFWLGLTGRRMGLHRRLGVGYMLGVAPPALSRRFTWRSIPTSVGSLAWGLWA